MNISQWLLDSILERCPEPIEDGSPDGHGNRCFIQSHWAARKFDEEALSGCCVLQRAL